MSWNKSKEDNKSSGSGLATGLAVAGGAAAVGFFLYKMFSENTPEPPTRSACIPSTQSRTASFSFVDEDEVVNDVRNKMTHLGNRREVPVKLVTNNSTVNKRFPSCNHCHREPQDVVLLPCNHFLCESCAEEINSDCPFCHKYVTYMKPRYLKHC